jgi:hypothetical protein
MHPCIFLLRSFKLNSVLNSSGRATFSSAEETQRNRVSQNICYALFSLLGALSFFCLSAGKVLVLDRMAAFATHAAGHRVVVFGFWFLVFGFCFLVFVLWFVVCGLLYSCLWFVIFGSLFVVCSLPFDICGLWFAISG